MKVRTKDIEAAREVRLWIGQIIVPGFMMAVAVFPELRQKIVDKVYSLKSKLSKK